MYYIKKKIIYTLGLLAALCVAAVSSFHLSRPRQISELTRPEKSGDIANHVMSAVIGDDKYDIEYELEPKSVTFSKLSEMFDSAESELEKILLGDNDSLSNVCYPLNLVDTLPEFDMDVTWYIDNLEVLNYFGEILNDEGGTSTEVTARLTYTGKVHEGDKEVYEREHTFLISTVAYPYTEEELIKLQIYELLQDYDEEQELSDIMVLPKKLEGKNISFVDKGDKFTAFIPFMLILDILLYLLVKKERQRLEKKKYIDELEREYPEIVMKLYLLIGAGMTPFNALNKLTADYSKSQTAKKRPAYEEIAYTVNQIRNGTPENSAYENLGRRYGAHSYIKLGTLLSQNTIRGNHNLRDSFRTEVSDAMNTRRNRALVLGEKVSTKLLFPMMIMLVIVLIIIIIPAFMSF